MTEQNRLKTDKLEEVILAAMFHDIGKFSQRAGAQRSNELTETFAPSKDGIHSHLHVLNTYYFIENLLKLPKNLDKSAIARIASNHHKAPQDLTESCVITADHLASGADRFSENEDNEISNSYIRERLISIFEEIEGLGKHKFQSKTALRYPLCELNKNPFPDSTDYQDKQKSETEYKHHWNRFIQKLSSNEALNTASTLPVSYEVFEHYLGGLKAILEEYLWCVPSSSYKSLPDISLYDHGLLTASIAQALYLFHLNQGGEPTKDQEDKNQKKFILFGGDLSGIQNYIFDINKSQSAGVAKLFRARSFYLQMITKACILEILDRLNLYSVAQIMDAGGKFMLLLPNLPHVQQTIKNFEEELQQSMLTQFKGLLVLNTAYVEASFEDLLLTKFNQTLDQFFDVLEFQKLQKFSASFRKKYHPVITDNYSQKYEGNCHLCEKNEGSQSKSDRFRQNRQLGESFRICDTCFDQIEILGTELAKHNDYPYFKLFKEANSNNAGHLIFNWHVKFLKTVTLSDWKAQLICNRNEHKDFGFHPLAGNLPLIAKEDLDHWKYTGFADQLTANGEMVAEGDPKTFEMLAQKSLFVKPDGNVAGKPFLGVLKADVDNLGFIFSIGFPRQKLSISRFSGLSRMLNYFFAVKLPHLIHKENLDIYVIFAGGDDLFLLGPWIQLVSFAETIRSEFDRFTARNPEITISAGVHIAKPALPIKDMSRGAEHLLEKAKKSEGKNAISIFDEVCTWEEFSRQIDNGKFLNDLLQEKLITTGLAYRLLGYSDQATRFEQGEIKSGMYLSHLKYDLIRNITGL
ncbi:MAG: type III-A CRISPR-associated protein Cas10/Csm1 [SAR324 cluster bacterium]|nr:type III-A CRISPR-associated protein Cas10/Csm1 [SAR324 cluster bacterium]